jgi:putative NIF3 family GTP cyclohydrolase 1 type 2
MTDLSRRTFLFTASTAMTTRLVSANTTSAPLTAGEVVERIRKQVGVPWRPQTVDQIVAGSASTPVTGIATTMMATLDVVQRAAAAGKNLIITHETPFYLHQDHTEDIKDDPVLKYKLDFISNHNMAIFHFHDHWHAHKPDGIAWGMVRQLGWEKNADPGNPKQLTFSGEPLAHFCKNMQSRLHARTIRVIGDPHLPVKRVLTSWGFVSREPGISFFSTPGIDVFICGETREWELVEYVCDSITAGNKKALIVVGHVLSEQGGMIYCAEWLKPFIPEVPIEFIPTREPFWSPDHPVQNA